MTDIAKQTLAITEKNLKASFEYARKLIQAKDINEVMRLQTEFLRTQFATATEPLEKLGGKSTAKDASNEKPELI
jgi:phasin family protein